VPSADINAGLIMDCAAPRPPRPTRAPWPEPSSCSIQRRTTRRDDGGWRVPLLGGSLWLCRVPGHHPAPASQVSGTLHVSCAPRYLPAYSRGAQAQSHPCIGSCVIGPYVPLLVQIHEHGHHTWARAPVTPSSLHTSRVDVLHMRAPHGALSRAPSRARHMGGSMSTGDETEGFSQEAS